MITLKLEPYKDPYERPAQQHRQPIGATWGQASPYKMEKLEFALFLKTLDVEVGDLVVFGERAGPLTVHECNLVVDIDEIHKFVDWGNSYSGPKILSLACLSHIPNHGLCAPWKAGVSSYKKISKDRWPKEWVEFMAKQPKE